MKILRSIRSVNPAIGGPVESVRQSSVELIRRGHVIEVASLDGPTDPWVASYPTKVHALGPGQGKYGYASNFTPWIREHRTSFDAVIIHGVWQYNSYGVWRALHGDDTPYYVFPHGMLDPWFKRTYPLKHLKKWLYWPWADYRVLRDAEAVLFTSEEERQLARESFSLYHCNEVVVNYGTAAPQVSLEAARETFLRSFSHIRGKRALLFLSRLHEKKGCDLLIKAFAASYRQRPENELHLVIAGPARDEEYLDELRKLVTTLFSGGEELPVTFTGMLEGDLKWGAFAAAEAFILPSHQENFGISVVEALAAGVPVLVSNCVNIWREIQADGAGFVDSDDVEGTTRLIERWLETTDEERSTMRQKAKQCFSRRFEIARATDSLLAVLQSRRAKGRA